MKINELSTAFSMLSEAKVESSAESDVFQTILENAAKEKDIEGLKKACQEFESFFVQKIFTQMRTSIGAMEKSQAESTYEGLLDEQMAKEITKAGGIGLASSMFETMKKAYALEDAPKGIDIKG